ncbi:hypothetical protein [Marispirochaeta aestuarii]|uniref:hypothetical protein n=1 Tax=Marispirochaeta aestuarii TaxID=1963862 RepID=UPI002ABE97B6|nr:hypothetical protein [Marispirochaeta aestuarii]
MQLGSAIFLSVVFLSLLYFINTKKNKWNWNIILKRFLIVSFSLLLIITIIGLAYSFFNELPKQEKEFWGLKLNSTKSDIKFLKGVPTESENGRYWAYVFDLTAVNSPEQALYIIFFEDDKIRSIIYNGPRYNNSPKIQNIGIGSTYKEVIDKFGSPDYVSISSDELKRALIYDKYKVYFEISKNQVISLGIINPECERMKYKIEK